MIDAGAFDYPADSWGFTYGIAVELTVNNRALRGSVFQLSGVPNGKITAIDFSQYMLVTEVEQRYQWQNHLGKRKLLGSANRGRMARYNDAVGLARTTEATPDVALVRKCAWHSDAAINMEQELSSDIGLFARGSVNDGSKEAYEFTKINRSIAAVSVF